MAIENIAISAHGVADVEMPELTPEKLKGARSFADLLAAKGIRRPGRPPSEDPKVRITIRLDTAVVEHFRAKGAGWQTRLNEALVGVVESDKRAPPQLPRGHSASQAKTATRKPAAKKVPAKTSVKAAPKPAAAKKAPAKKAAAKKAASAISGRAPRKLTA